MATSGDDPPHGLPGAWRRIGRTQWVYDFEEIELSTMPERGAGACSAVLIAGAGVVGLIALGLFAAR